VIEANELAMRASCLTEGRRRGPITKPTHLTVGFDGPLDWETLAKHMPLHGQSFFVVVACSGCGCSKKKSFRNGNQSLRLDNPINDLEGTFEPGFWNTETSQQLLNLSGESKFLSLP
jgi:hypothetical protein